MLLSRLDGVLQIVMGWTNSHLHQFIIGGRYYGLPYPDVDDTMEVTDERTVRLDQAAPKAKSRFIYEYDFGDSWEHEIAVEKILAPEPDVKYPRCLAGKRACPPEDAGGCGAIRSSCRPFAIQSIPSMKRCCSGLAGTSILKRSTYVA